MIFFQERQGVLEFKIGGEGMKEYEKQYGLLVVDDEDLIREAVTTLIDWKSLGFSHIYEAEDGEEALLICRRSKVDLVLTDIVMPFMDGIELSRVLKEEFPQIHIVILTGHEEFDYAKQSIYYGVKNYILKPVGKESLFREMQAICETLHIENKQKQYIAKMSSQLHQSLPLLREKFLYSLVCTSYRKGQENKKRIANLEIPLYSKQYLVGIIEADFEKVADEDMEIFLFALKNICMDTVGSKHCVLDDGQRIVIVFNLDRYGEGSHTVIYDTMEVILKAIGIAIKIPAAGALGSRADDIDNLYQSYREAGAALEYRYLLGYNRIYDIKDIEHMGKVFLYPTNEIKQLLYSMKFLGRKELRASMERIENACIVNKSLSVSNIKMIYFEILNGILKELSAARVPKKGLWQQGIDLYRQMDMQTTIRQFSSKILEFACAVSRTLQTAQSSSSQELICRAEDYMEQQYMNPELSQSMVASQIGISTGYLSGLFKKESGRNFIEALTEIRMCHAMELMKRTDKKNYQIAAETGFSNPHYFSISFKKYSGMSPSEFRSKAGV